MQVYFRNKHVGDVRVPAPSPGMREIRMNVAEAPAPAAYRSAADPLPSFKVRQVAMPIGFMQIMIDDIDLQRNPSVVDQVLANYDVHRSQCEEMRMFDRQQVVYRWKVIEIKDPDLMEEVFEMDAYQPCDEGFDPFYFEQRQAGIGFSV